MDVATVALGSNLGNKKENLQKSVRLIAAENKVIQLSKLYRTAPYGITEQDDFLNAAIQIETSKNPLELLQFLLNIEKTMGRVRGKKWGPRIIDLDIIFFDHLVVNEPELIIPHPDYKNRNFVLLPLADIMPDFVPPGEFETIEALTKKIDRYTGIKIEEEVWIQ
ncbi:MAG: 2-amino-4-hydroxy-6-hydroxymethyldihydropteridine diphosphokinase [Calditrichia bacterium]